MEKNTEVWEDLILSILSVNHYSLEKTFALAGALRREGILDPANLANWPADEIAGHLRQGGYDRGNLNPMFAKRLSSLGLFVKKVGIDHAAGVLATGNGTELKQFLATVNGVGPQVLANFLGLRPLTK